MRDRLRLAFEALERQKQEIQARCDDAHARCEEIHARLANQDVPVKTKHRRRKRRKVTSNAVYVGSLVLLGLLAGFLVSFVCVMAAFTPYYELFTFFVFLIMIIGAAVLLVDHFGDT